MEFELAPGRLIGPDHPVFIIAEIGQNHQGNENRINNSNYYLVQLIEHPILWIPNILFVYFLSIFSR